jgi:predicted DNA-binding antitoxin AbrB/MazE fold protein
MTYEIDAIYNNGAFVPVTPLTMPEGVRVHLRIDEQAKPVAAKMMTRAEFDDFLCKMAQLPIEGPDDGFSGADHDKLLYGQP